jgi:hypothetical protein
MNFKIICELLNRPEFQLPLNRSDQDLSYFPNLVDSKIKSVIKCLKNNYADFPEIQDLIVPIQGSCKYISEILDLYFRGLIFKAFDKFKLFFKTFDKIIEDLSWISEKLYAEIDNSISDSTISDPFDTFYRGRISNDSFNKIQKPEDIFHPPFQKQYTLQNYRYSINGHPSLYLGNSAYVCWHELNKPDFNNFNIVRLRTKKNHFKFLDLSIRPQTLAFFIKERLREDNLRKMNNWTQKLKNYLECWPILLVCSIPIKKDDINITFHPEYIFPQFLLQLITENENTIKRGISYFSITTELEDNTKSSYNFGDYVADLLLRNFVIPIIEGEEEGFSNHLREQFNISFPNSAARFSINKSNHCEDKFWKNGNKHIHIPSILHNKYNTSIFGQLERSVYPIGYSNENLAVWIDNDSMKILTPRTWHQILTELNFDVSRKSQIKIKAFISNKKPFSNFFNDLLRYRKYKFKGIYELRKATFTNDEGEIIIISYYTEEEALKELCHLPFLVES